MRISYWSSDVCSSDRERGQSSQGPADDLLHDLGGAGVDLRDAHVGPDAGDRVLVHVPVAAVQLEAGVGDALRPLRAPQLHHGSGGDVQTPGEVELDATVDEGPCAASLGGNFRHLELSVMEPPDRTTDGAPVMHVGPRLGQED